MENKKLLNDEDVKKVAGGEVNTVGAGKETKYSYKAHCNKYRCRWMSDWTNSKYSLPTSCPVCGSAITIEERRNY